MSQREEKLFCQDWLEIETILESENFLFSISVCLTPWDVKYSPFIFMSPCWHIRKDLRFTRSTASPEHDTRVCTLKVR
jgi:hypothetical protein